MPFSKRLWGIALDMKGTSSGTDDASPHKWAEKAERGEEDMPRDLTQIQREALEWLALMVSGEATTEDIRVMESWRRQSSAHAEAMAFAVKMRRLGKAYKFPGSEQFPPSLLERPITRRLAMSCVAATVAGCGLLRPPLGLWPSFAELSSDYRTGIGERQQVALGDGLSMELNTRTSVALYAKALPSIHLIAGEIVVAAKMARPREFVALAQDGMVTASQASFDLRCDGDFFCATCLDGTIEVTHGRNKVRLQSGYAVTYNGESGGTPYAVDAAIATAWRHGELVFYDKPLSVIVAEINRYRSGKIVITNSALAARHFDSTFYIAHIEDAVADLERITNGSVTRIPGGVVLLG